MAFIDKLVAIGSYGAAIHPKEAFVRAHRLHVSLLVAALAMSSSTGCGAGGMAAEGALHTPDFELASLDGETIRLSEHIGKHAVLVTFWQVSCAGCLQQMQVFEDLWKRYKDRGLVVLAIAVDGPQTSGRVRAAVADRGVTFPVLLDSDASVHARYDSRFTIPTTLLLDRKGNTVLKLSGQYFPGKSPALDQTIERALSPENGPNQPAAR